MDRYQGMVHSQAKKAFLTEEEAEDFTQDVFLSVYESLSKFRGEAQFSTWLFQIARNRLVHWKKQHAMVPLEEGQAKSPDHSESIMEKMASDDKVSSLHQLIAKLPKVYQTPIRLHFFENKPLREISNELGIKLNTLKSHISRGKELIRKWWSHES